MLYHKKLASMQIRGPINVGFWGILHRVKKDDLDEEDFRILAAPLLTTWSASQASPNPTDDFINFSELLTKPETIIESPGAQDWDWYLSKPSNLQSTKSHNPSNRFWSYTKPMASTSLHSSKSVPPASDSGSNKSQPTHGLFFQQIVRDSMDYSSLQDSENPEFKRLCGSASS